MDELLLIHERVLDDIAKLPQADQDTANGMLQNIESEISKYEKKPSQFLKDKIETLSEKLHDFVSDALSAPPAQLDPIEELPHEAFIRENNINANKDLPVAIKNSIKATNGQKGIYNKSTDPAKREKLHGQIVKMSEKILASIQQHIEQNQPAPTPPTPADPNPPAPAPTPDPVPPAPTPNPAPASKTNEQILQEFLDNNITKVDLKMLKKAGYNTSNLRVLGENLNGYKLRKSNYEVYYSITKG